MPIKQSNRLTVVLNDDMTVSYKQGINTVYLNSHLYNEFVVRPRSKLRTAQTLWITFATSANFNTATNKTQPTLLAYRDVTAQNGLHQVADETQVQTLSDCEQSFEYYMQIPDVVLQVASTWYFSLEIREVPDINEPKNYSLIATSGVYSFVVNNSLAGQGHGNGTPTDLDIVALYLTAVNAAERAQEASNRAPYIGPNSHWFVFDSQAMQFVDTGIVAEGKIGLSALVLTENLVEESTGDFADESIRIGIEKFNRTPLVGESFFAFVDSLEQNQKFIDYFVVRTVDKEGAWCQLDLENNGRIDITPKQGEKGDRGEKGEKGEKGDNYYTFSIKEGDLIVKTTESDNPDVTHGIDNFGNMILTLK